MRTLRNCLVLGLVGASAALSQVAGGAFRGEVHDASSAVVPQTRILIRSNETGIETVAQSNADGLYVTPNLIPGRYLLTATRQGFKAEVFGPVNLPVSQIVRVDFVLTIGTQAESIQVEAKPAQMLKGRETRTLAENAR